MVEDGLRSIGYHWTVSLDKEPNFYQGVRITLTVCQDSPRNAADVSCLSSLPDVSSLPNLSDVSSFPSVSCLPSLPDVSSFPSVPSVPILPNLPDVDKQKEIVNDINDDEDIVLVD